MKKFAKPERLRILIAGLSLFVLGMTAATFYRSASTPTDENLFSDAPSRIMVTRDIPVQFLEERDRQGENASQLQGNGWIHAGDLFISLNGEPVKQIQKAQTALQHMNPDSSFLAEFFVPEPAARVMCRVMRGSISDLALTGLPPVLTVIDVTQGGASDRAGMRVGDLIVRVEGKEFGNALEADRLLRAAQSGRVFTYDVMRRGQPLTLSVTLAQFGFPLALLLFCITGLVYMGVGSFLAIKRPQIRAARLIGLSFILLGFFVSVFSARREVTVDLFVVASNVLLVFSLFFGMGLGIIGSFFFPKEHPEILARPWIIRTLLGLAAGWSVMLILSLAFPVLGNLQGIVIFSGIGSMTLFGIGVHLAFRKYRTAEHRRMSRAIKISGLVVALVTLAVVLMKGEALRLIGFVLMLMPLSYLYTIGRYRLLDMNLRMRRNIQYTIVTAAWSIFMAVVLVTAFFGLLHLTIDLPAVFITGRSVEFGDRSLSPATQDLGRKGVVMVLSIGIWYVLWRIRKGGRQVIDRIYNRTRYDFRHATAELTSVLATNLSMLELGKGIARKLSELMRLKRTAVLFFRDESVCCCQQGYGLENGEWTEFCLSVDVRLIDALKTFTGEFRVDYLPGDIKEIFRGQGYQYVVPIRSHEKLIGVLLLGEKLSEATLSEEDLAFLSAAALQASVAIENAFLYEEIAEKERMKHELGIARRIQLESLPQKMPAVEGLDIAGTSVPALEVGGDFFDYLNGSPGALTVIVGDVSGKGTSAALYMSKVQGILRSLHDVEPTPAGLFKRANGLLCKDLERKSFVTALGAAFDTNKKSFLLARAGHLPLYYFCAASGIVEKITPRGLGLGLNDEGVFADELEQRVVPYSSGDVFLFVTDGVTEAWTAEADEFGDDRLSAMLPQSAALPASAILDAILAGVHEFAGNTPQHDDQTIVVVKAL